MNRLYTYIHRTGRYLATALACGTMAACSLDIPYENQFSDPDAITTSETARELLANAYAQLPLTEYDLSTLADDFETTFLISNNASLNNLYGWETQPITDLSKTIWQSYYAAIGMANAMLDRVQYVQAETDSEKKDLQQTVAEAKILKAYCYFNLLRLYAPDYADGTDYDGVILKEHLGLEFLKRSTTAECVAAIRGLLTDALSTVKDGEEYWFSKTAANYLMAQVDLYAQDYAEAATYAQQVIDAKGGYAALGSNAYANLFTNDNCAERIFSISTTIAYYSDNQYDREKGDFMTVNSNLVNSYSTNDLRRDGTIYTFKMATQLIGDSIDAPNLAKYNLQRNYLNKDINRVNKFRLSGACLILAEAYCRDNKASEAAKVLNSYLEARQAEPVDETLTGDALLKVILQERWKEFEGEGERYFDLKRFRKTILSGWNTGISKKKNIKADDYRWNFPLPTGEYLYNENVKQNEGWETIKN